ncbi:septal ring lytic transglycosylase RlpA family protein [Marichromatium bheemlicum]|uniref:Endolytic peptidoglycan transglycosylase RlpA n=1 Tax=Marichromatium bheemlicum TaxID=365339 RepID=A0ABX1IBI5_9GAMM|nr:septal ring lytic transglycosylase RlpA family protein [Marichromatium bheemlicum]NKN34628.1 septal ring lytic transglycosylase RlpA family protein [Marichromatium bheemlicum]
MHHTLGILRHSILSLLLLVPAFQASAAVTPGDVQKGIASYYHDSLHGLPTASGTPYDKHRLSAAHKTLPLGTKVRVTDTATGKSIVVRINDRGPFIKGRIIDLSRAAAARLDMLHKGLARVRVEILSVPGRRGS